MAQAMEDYYHTAYLTGCNSIGERVRAYKDLQDDSAELEMLFTVDILNEGLDAPTIKRVLKASVLNPYWEKFERGEVTEEETLQAFIAADPEIEKALRTAFTNLSGMLVIRDYAIPLVQQLKEAGLGVYYLSNYSRKAYDECGESLAFMPYMDGGIVSFKVGMTKPDSQMYKCFLDRYGLEVESCVFIDDTEENVTAAKELGFSGIVFTTYEEVAEELKKTVGCMG